MYINFFHYHLKIQDKGKLYFHRLRSTYRDSFTLFWNRFPHFKRRFSNQHLNLEIWNNKYSALNVVNKKFLIFERKKPKPSFLKETAPKHEKFVTLLITRTRRVSLEVMHYFINSQNSYWVFQLTMAHNNVWT